MAIDDVLRNKKKKKKEEEKKKSSSQSINSILREDIAQKEEKDTYFQKGAYRDGYEKGDLSKSILASFDDIQHNFRTGVVGMGEKIVDAGATVVGGVGGLFSKDFKEDVGDFIEKDLYDSEKVADNWITKLLLGSHFDMATTSANVMGADITENDSFLGEKSDSLVQSGTEMLATYGVQALTGGAVPWWLITGTTSLGASMEESLRDGANYDQAMLTAGVQTVGELLTEKLFGGSGLGEKGLINLEPLTKGIANKVVKSFADYGIDVLAEGTEEVVSQVVSNLATKIYKDESFKDVLLSEEAFEGYLDSFIGGAVIGGGMNVGNIASHVKNKTDYRTDLTANEQKILDQVVEEEIAEAEKNGKTLTKKEKNEIEQKWLTTLKRGEIDTDIIEKAFAEEDHNAYNELTKEADEYNSLLDIADKDMTARQRKRLAELEAKNTEQAYKDRLLDSRSKLSENLYNATKNDQYLQGTFAERGRRGEAFTVSEEEMKQYSDAEKKIVQKAIEYGEMNNTKKAHEFVQLVAKLCADKGLDFDFTNNEKLAQSGFAIEGKTINGFKQGNKITVNMQTNALEKVVGHEVTHVLEGTNLYQALQDTVFEYAETKGVFNDLYNTAFENYKGVYKNMTEEKYAEAIRKEVTADLVGEYIFSDKEFVRNLSTKNQNVFEKVYSEIKYLLKSVTSGSDAEKQLLKAKKIFEDVYRDTKKNTSDKTQMSIDDIDIDLDRIYEEMTLEEAEALIIDIEDLIKLPSKWGLEIEETKVSKPRYKGDTKTKGKVAKLTDERIEHLFNEYGASNPSYAKAYVTSIHPRDFLSLTLSDESLEKWDNATKQGTDAEYRPLDVEKLKNERQTPFLEVDTETGRVIGHEGRHRMRALLEAGVTEVPIAVIDINTKYSKQKESSMRLSSQEFYEGYVNDNFKTEVKNLIPLNKVNSNEIYSAYGGKGDIQYSVADNKGRTLTKEQQEKFKDSVVRDEEGNLIPLYHGTTSTDIFTEFKHENGVWLSTDYDYAKEYSGWWNTNFYSKGEGLGKDVYADNNLRIYEMYADIKNPFNLGEINGTLSDGKVSQLANALGHYVADKTGDMKQGGTVAREVRELAKDYVGEKTYQFTRAKEFIDFAKKHGFDGFVATEYGKKTYCVFNSSDQVKLATNQKPTDNADIRFSLSSNVEETKDLIAIHNLQSSELAKTLELGGFPMPSIAIIKAEQGHEKYGDVSVIFPKETIDPKASKDNKVYGGDAWTPTYPTIEYKPSAVVEKRISDKYYELAKRIGYDGVRPLYRYANTLEEALNRDGGESAMLERLYDDTDMMQIYLEDSGIGKVEPIVKETETKMTDVEIGMSQYIINALGEDIIAEFKSSSGFNHTKEYMDKYDAEIRDAYIQYFIDEHGFTEDMASEVVSKTSKGQLLKYIRNAYNYTQNNGVTIKTETDYQATQDAIREASKDGYKEWIDNLFKGVEEKTGIRNDKEAVTDNGIRSWDALHWEHTLENVVKAMKLKEDTGADAFMPASSLFAVSQRQYKSIKEIKDDSKRLGLVYEEDFKAIEKEYASRFSQIAQSIQDPKETNQFIANDTASREIIDAIQHCKTKAEMLKYMQRWNNRVTKKTVDDIVSLVTDIANMPTGYFEAKPKRAVGLEEVGVFVIPNNAEPKLKQALLQGGYSIAEYDPNIEGDRKRVVNGFEDLKFSLSSQEQPLAPTQNFTNAEDIALERPIAPTNLTEKAIAHKMDGSHGEYGGYEWDFWGGNSQTNKATIRITRPNGTVEDVTLGYDNWENELTSYIMNDMQQDTVDGYAPPIAPRREVHGMDVIPPPQENEVRGMKIQKGMTLPTSETIQPKAPTETKSGKELRRWAETSTESEVVGGAIKLEDLDQDIIHYEPISNKSTLQKANTKLDTFKSYEDAMTYFNSQMSANKVELVDLVMGERLLQEAIKRKDTKNAGELIQNIAVLGTELGRKVQALSIIQRLTPEGQLKMIQKTVDRGKVKGDKIFKDVELTDDMRQEILDAYNEDGSYDQDKLNSAIESVKQQLADQMGVTGMERVNAWRMLSMLGNPKTHIRNVVSNMTMFAVREAKDSLARTIETGVDATSKMIAPINPKLAEKMKLDTRTKTWQRASDDVKTFSQQATKDAEALLKSEHRGTDSTTLADIKAKRKVFGNSILQKVYGLNSDLLQGEDTFFKRPVYRRSLQEFLTANGIKTQEDINNNIELVEKGKKYAMEQSLIATFQQESWLAETIGRIERKNVGTQIAVGSVLPFKKTPINIAKTGLAYSPLGFTKTLAYDMPKVMNGEMEASQLIDNISQATTGTALMLTGYLLSSIGMLNGGGEDDREGEYDYQLGEQSYSLNLGGKSYSLSWLTPASMPLFIGANFYEMFSKGERMNFDATVDALASTLDPMSEMSFLSSLDTALSSYDSGTQKFMGIFENAGQSYVSQFAPTLLSQVAQVTDDTKRSTTASADSDARMVEQTIRKLMYKIPGLRQMLEPTIDIHGNEVKQSDNALVRGLESFIAPYNTKDYIADDVDMEIKELYAQTGDSGVIPSVPSSKVNYKGETYKMSAKEFTEYKKTYGQTANDYLGRLFNTSTYQGATIEEKNDMVNKVYDYARDVAHKEYLGKEGIQYTNTTEDNVPVYKENKIKGAIEHDMTVDEYDLYSTDKGKYGISQCVGGFDSYTAYKNELKDIHGDKNIYGKTISGSKKKKVLSYINGLNADYYTKIILFKAEYPSDDTYNADIIDYVNGRSDFTYQEKVDTLTELGFTVLTNGTVRWD